MQRAADPVDTQCLATFQSPFYMRDASRSLGGIRRDQALCRVRICRDCRSFQPQVIQHPRCCGIVLRGALKNRNFHAVKSGFLDPGQQRPVLRANRRGPQKHAHANFHRPSPWVVDPNWSYQIDANGQSKLLRFPEFFDVIHRVAAIRYDNSGLFGWKFVVLTHLTSFSLKC